MKTYRKVRLAGSNPTSRMRNSEYGPVWHLFTWRDKEWIQSTRTRMMYEFKPEEWKVLKEDVIEIPEQGD